MDGLVERRDSINDRYYDVIVYNRELSAKECADYELDKVGETDGI